MDWTERRERFRGILNGSRCFHPASVYDAMSARIAEDLGYEVGMLAGSTGSMSVLGAPDLIVLTLTEFAAQCYRVCRAGNIALLVDADHGYGNALNVKRTVEELETAGVSALTIEDTVLPRPYGATKTTLIPIEEGVGKMKAALAGRQDPRLVVAGRTGALRVTGLEDTIARCKAYEAAGVDALFLAGASKQGRGRSDLAGDHASADARRWSGPVRRRRLVRRAPGQDRAARAPADRGGGAGRVHHDEGAP